MVKNMSKLNAGDVVLGGNGQPMLKVERVEMSRANTVILVGEWLAASERDGSRVQGKQTFYPTGRTRSQIVEVL